jgi:hypothetical protein
MTKLEILKEFSPADKLDQVQRQKIMKLEVAFKDLVSEVCDMVPDINHRSSAIRSLLDAKFYCTHAITHTKLKPTEKEKIQDGEENSEKSSEKSNKKNN